MLWPSSISDGLPSFVVHPADDRDHPKSVQIPANGLVFDALEWGPPAGRTVLLLHGFPQRANSWTGVAGLLADIGKPEELRVVAVNQRGYSPGARPSEVSAYSVHELVADVVGVIEWLGGAVDLVGHDFGAVVGWQVAGRYPELVRTWTAVSTPSQLALNEVLNADAAQRERFDYIRRFREVGRAEDALLADNAAGFRAIFGRSVAGEQVAEDAEFFSQPGVLTAALNWYRAMSVHDADGLGPVRVPTTYIWGSEDTAFSREAAERTEAYVEAPYRFVALEGAGHWLPDEAAATVAEVIAEQIFDE
jgi:pimeloyl-ACP methyl ester carboxylesterase